MGENMSEDRELLINVTIPEEDIRILTMEAVEKALREIKHDCSVHAHISGFKTDRLEISAEVDGTITARANLREAIIEDANSYLEAPQDFFPEELDDWFSHAQAELRQIADDLEPIKLAAIAASKATGD